MSAWQVSPDRRWSLGRLAIVALAGFVVVFVGMWSVGATGGLILGAGPNGEGCRMFWGEGPEDIGWSPSGEFLVVTTHSRGGDDYGDPGVRVFRWPGMALVSQTKAYAEPATIDDRGVLRWQTETSTLPAETMAWRMDPGQEPVAGPPDASPAVAVGETQPGLAISSRGVAARKLDSDSDGSTQLCLEAPLG
jgi:hypothetical protein